MTRQIVAVSGGFDPLHAGHVHMIREASALGEVIVLLNSDAWLLRKKGYVFMPWAQRAEILRQMKGVVSVVAVDDSDGTVCKALATMKPDLFVNSGDRTMCETPEIATCAEHGVIFRYVPPHPEFAAIHSSALVKVGQCSRIVRPWGYFNVLTMGKGYKVKELVVTPREALSYQRHKRRIEFWYVATGVATITIENGSFSLGEGKDVRIWPMQWHRLTNNNATPLTVIEIQIGDCDESDLERREDKYGRAA